MAQRRGNNGVVVATMLVVVIMGVTLMLLAPAINAHHPVPCPPTTYYVGDKIGWNFRSDEWLHGKTFKAGDILVFSYTPETHNVAEVCQHSYDTCTVPPDARVHNTGDDRITLRPGMNFFICGVPGHCEMGMKLAVNAL